MTRPRAPTLLRIAAVITLFALGLMVWSVVDPSPIPIVVAMSVGQALGTLSFLIYLAVVALDLRRSHVLDQRMSDPPPAPRVP